MLIKTPNNQNPPKKKKKKKPNYPNEKPKLNKEGKRIKYIFIPV